VRSFPSMKAWTVGSRWGEKELKASFTSFCVSLAARCVGPKPMPSLLLVAYVGCGRVGGQDTGQCTSTSLGQYRSIANRVGPSSFCAQSEWKRNQIFTSLFTVYGAQRPFIAQVSIPKWDLPCFFNINKIWTLFQYAVSKDNADLMDQLHRLGCNIDARDQTGNTALHIAAKKRRNVPTQTIKIVFSSSYACTLSFLTFGRNKSNI